MQVCVSQPGKVGGGGGGREDPQGQAAEFGLI